MLTARAFSYTLVGADQRDYRKNAITVETSLRTYDDQTERLRWSPYIGDSTGDGEPDRPAPIPVADEWGTVYDTIGYTVTGALGFWIDDSRIGLGGVGINNEMALSNLAPNSVYEPALNQTHIDGNKGLIYSQIAALLFEEDVTFEPGGKVAYVENPLRITNDGSARPANPSNLPSQHTIDTVVPCVDSLQPQLTGGCDGAAFEEGALESHLHFDVLGPEDGYWNGGMTVTSTRPATEQGANVAAVHANVVIERWDESHGEPGWVTAKDLNRTSVTVNDPPPGEYRVTIPHTTGFPRRVTIAFDPTTAEEDPGQLPYSVSSTDFFTELNDYVEPGDELVGVDIVTDVLGGPGTLRDYDTLIVTNNLGRAEYLEQELGLASGQIATYFERLEQFARDGGNLVLTDSGLHALERMGIVADGAVAQLGGGSGGSNVAGAYRFDIGGGTLTYEDAEAWPLAAGLDLRGAGELQTGRRQAVEPTPLGYNPNSGGTHARMPFWGVERGAWEAACDKGEPSLCTTALVAQSSSHTQVGEIGLGDGVVRIVGTLLPDPLETEDTIADNRFGLASYAITYTGYIVFENLVDYARNG